MAHQTAISRYERDALAKAAEQATQRVVRHADPDAIAPLGFAFRVDDATYSVSSGWGDDEYYSDTRIEIEAFIVAKVTEKGFRIVTCEGWGRPSQTRWIAHNWTKQFASRTPEDAMRSYIARRKKQASIYRARAARAEGLVSTAERMLEKQKEPAL